MHTLYPLALLEMSSTLPWMLSIGLDWVGMFSSAVWATVLSLGMSVIVSICLFCEELCYIWCSYVFDRGRGLLEVFIYHKNFCVMDSAEAFCRPAKEGCNDAHG